MVHFLFASQSYDFGIQANQLSDILCRGATVSSIQSTNNTLTRNASMRGDTGDYDVPHPHPYTHHYMSTSSTTATPQAMSTVGSRPGSAGGSGSGSSPGGCMSIGSCDGGGSIAGILPSTVGGGVGMGTVNYLDCMHYERMPLPVPIPIVPPPQLHSEEEIEPAYATGKIKI